MHRQLDGQTDMAVEREDKRATERVSMVLRGQGSDEGFKFRMI